MTPTDYQREYEALYEWAHPHVHYWRYDYSRDCLSCRWCPEIVTRQQALFAPNSVRQSFR